MSTEREHNDPEYAAGLYHLQRIVYDALDRPGVPDHIVTVVAGQEVALAVARGILENTVSVTLPGTPEPVTVLGDLDQKGLAEKRAEFLRKMDEAMRQPARTWRWMDLAGFDTGNPPLDGGIGDTPVYSPVDGAQVPVTGQDAPIALPSTQRMRLHLQPLTKFEMRVPAVPYTLRVIGPNGETVVHVPIDPEHETRVIIERGDT